MGARRGNFEISLRTPGKLAVWRCRPEGSPGSIRLRSGNPATSARALFGDSSGVGLAYHEFESSNSTRMRGSKMNSGNELGGNWLTRFRVKLKSVRVSCLGNFRWVHELTLNFCAIPTQAEHDGLGFRLPFQSGYQSRKRSKGPGWGIPPSLPSFPTIRECRC